MTAKEYLGEIRRLTGIIEELERSMEILQDDIEGIKGIQYDKDKVMTSASGDAMLNKIIRLEQLSEEIGDTMIERAKKRAHITTQITLMPNRNYMQLLFKRYVEFKRFEQIAVEMNYSYDRIVHIHSEALQDFEERYDMLAYNSI